MEVSGEGATSRVVLPPNKARAPLWEQPRPLRAARLGLGWVQLPRLALCLRPSVTDSVLLTSVPPPRPPPAQLLEGAPLRGHCPGGEGPAGRVWHQRPQHDLGRPAVDVPPLAAPGNPLPCPEALLLFFFGGVGGTG